MIFNINEGTLSIKNSLEFCPKGPGIYQFIDEKENILYIGKAKNLKNRVSSYLSFNLLSNRIKKLIGLIRNIKFIKTHTEVDALILESNLIKKYKPPFNIRLIDDKAFPFIHITKTKKWARLEKIRERQKSEGFYFGPFASSDSVNRVLTILERGFLLRTCSDAEFKNRNRPCLLYQIKRCSAPCVGLISETNYQKLVFETINFLNGKDKTIKNNLIRNMNVASEKYEYERAALFRDRIKAISKISQEQYSFINKKSNFDLICTLKKNDLVCINVFFFRGGKNLGNKEYFFENQNEKTSQKILEEFLTIFYLKNVPPNLIVINKKIENINLIEDALKKSKKFNVKIFIPKKGKKIDLVKRAEENIQLSMTKHISNSKDGIEILNTLKEKLRLKNFPNKIEIYDNSHLQGTNPLGSMVVYKNYNFIREQYRTFNIKVVDNYTNDDYYMMNQVLNRRFNLNKNESSWKSELPDLVIIDGGKGHLNIVKKVFEEKKIKNIDLLAIAKGKNRNEGNETIFYLNDSFKLNKNSQLLFFLQRLRDEAHRFAISRQKYKRKIDMKKSIFDSVNGVGSKIKKNLLNHFGSLENIKTAGIKDLINVHGIGKSLAVKIYNEFNE